MSEEKILIFYEDPDGIYIVEIPGDIYKDLDGFLIEQGILNLERDKEGYYRCKYGGRFKIYKGKEVNLIATKVYEKFKVEDK